MPLIRMLYVVNDQEGKDIAAMLKSESIDCRVFWCSEDERKKYQCPRLLTTEGEWRGRKAIQQYTQVSPTFESIRKEQENKLQYAYH